MREYEREAEEPSLADFLERITLASDVDSYDPEKGAVALMTVHTAKGLEFPEVLVSLEEGVFPRPAQHRRRHRRPGRTPPVLCGVHARDEASAPVSRALAPAVGPATGRRA